MSFSEAVNFWVAKMAAEFMVVVTAILFLGILLGIGVTVLQLVTIIRRRFK